VVPDHSNSCPIPGVMNALLANALASSTQMNVTRKGFEILCTVVFINKSCFSFIVSLSDKRHTHCGNNYSPK